MFSEITFFSFDEPQEQEFSNFR